MGECEDVLPQCINHDFPPAITCWSFRHNTSANFGREELRVDTARECVAGSERVCTLSLNSLSWHGNVTRQSDKRRAAASIEDSIPSLQSLSQLFLSTIRQWKSEH